MAIKEKYKRCAELAVGLSFPLTAACFMVSMLLLVAKNEEARSLAAQVVELQMRLDNSDNIVHEVPLGNDFEIK